MRLTKEQCPRKKTFMTPCFLEDPDITLDDRGRCVGCGYDPEAEKAIEEIKQAAERLEKNLNVADLAARLDRYTKKH